MAKCHVSLATLVAISVSLVACGGSGNEGVTSLAPTVSLSQSPSAVVLGDSATLSWSSSNASSCAASGGWAGDVGTSGSKSTGPLTSSETYTLTCIGPGGSTARSATVTVTTPAPTVSLSASPSSILSGNSATLTWSSTNATSCFASGGWTGNVGTSGSQSTGVLTASQSYTLICTGPGGSTPQSATVLVTTPAPTVSLSASPTSILSGRS